MKRMLIEIRQFFVREKLYIFLLMTAIFLYVAASMVRHVVEKRKQSTDAVEAKQMETQKAPSAADAFNLEQYIKKSPKAASKLEFFFLLLGCLFVWGILLNFIAVGKWLLGKGFVGRVHTKLHIAWGVSEVLKVTILFLWYGVVLNIVLAVAKLLFFKSSQPYMFIFAHTLTIDLVAAFFMIRFIRQKGSVVGDVIGVHWPKISAKEIWLGLNAYVTVLPFILFQLIALTFLASLFSYNPPAHPLVDILNEEKRMSAFALWFSMTLACVIGPIVEEIFFRGFLYPAVKKYIGTIWAAIISSVLFACVHENVFSFIPIFFLGLVLCYLYERRKSVVPCVSLHIIHNSAFLAYFFFMKDVFK